MDAMVEGVVVGGSVSGVWKRIRWMRRCGKSGFGRLMKSRWSWAVVGGLGEVVMMKRRESGCRRSGGFVW